MSDQVSQRLNTRQAADYLGLSESFLNKDRLSSAQIPFFKINKRVIYERADLDAFLASRRRRNTSDVTVRANAAA